MPAKRLTPVDEVVTQHLNVKLDGDFFRRIRTAAKEQDQSVAGFVRTAVRRYLKELEA